MRNTRTESISTVSIVWPTYSLDLCGHSEDTISHKYVLGDSIICDYLRSERLLRLVF
jgi:hypothetical protein